jgi:hypothetical protein
MEPTEPTEVSNEFVGYESDNELLISLVTPHVSFKKGEKHWVEVRPTIPFL